MSSPPHAVDVSSDPADVSIEDRLRAAVATARHHVFKPVKVVGFWSAIALPFLYVPLLASGLETTAELTVFLGLLAANVVAIALGHTYSPE